MLAGKPDRSSLVTREMRYWYKEIERSSPEVRRHRPNRD